VQRRWGLGSKEAALRTGAANSHQSQSRVGSNLHIGGVNGNAKPAVMRLLLFNHPQIHHSPSKHAGHSIKRVGSIGVDQSLSAGKQESNAIDPTVSFCFFSCRRH